MSDKLISQLEQYAKKHKIDLFYWKCLVCGYEHSQQRRKCEFCESDQLSLRVGLGGNSILRIFYKPEGTIDIDKVMKTFKDRLQNNLYLKKYRRDHPRGKRKKDKFHSTLNGAIQRNIDFKLSKRQLKTIVSKLCIYCGSKENIGVDRIDSKLPYTKNNCQPCCAICNRMKFDLTEKAFKEHIKKIYYSIEPLHSNLDSRQ